MTDELNIPITWDLILPALGVVGIFASSIVWKYWKEITALKKEVENLKDGYSKICDTVASGICMEPKLREFFAKNIADDVFLQKADAIQRIIRETLISNGLKVPMDEPVDEHIKKFFEQMSLMK